MVSDTEKITDVTLDWCGIAKLVNVCIENLTAEWNGKVTSCSRNGIVPEERFESILS